MMFWEWVSLIARALIVAAVLLKLLLFYDHYHVDERAGLGVVGGCALMSCFTLLEPDSPFNSWSTALFAFGVAVYFLGRLRRQLHHYRANQAQIKISLERRSKR